ncbi:hypothetical protein [Flagellimonas sp. 2504JD4-2]
MKSQVKNTKWMYLLGGLVFLSGLLILWLLKKNKKPCVCKEADMDSKSSKGGDTSKGSAAVGAKGSVAPDNSEVLDSVDELKKLLVEKGNDNCGC